MSHTTTNAADTKALGIAFCPRFHHSSYGHNVNNMPENVKKSQPVQFEVAGRSAKRSVIQASASRLPV
ncbi:hypothetical protein SAMN05216174_12328 [Actinokineospora iranica]|uniref:Uncharacterized protein n=1 Tax=Actinokineospora iranica TaxID=1271860 RepID=A0A1G6YSR9_9PSEU|nr:hypothetical protein SAMN05216174_12328 [Actinokineospora iranica]